MIRSNLFKFFFYFGVISLCVIFTPFLIGPKKFISFAGKVSGYWLITCLKLFLSTKIIVRGKENIIKNEKFFIACTHQSILETFYLQTVFNSPFFILKKELLKIPLFGFFLKKIGCISIDRNKITKENLDFFEKVKKSVEKTNNPLIIFPQGKRYETRDRPNFKKGVSRIYKLNIKCQPVVINSGEVWPKVGNLNNNRELVVSFLKPINAGLDDKDFLSILEKCMYKELDKISSLS